MIDNDEELQAGLMELENKYTKAEVLNFVDTLVFIEAQKPRDKSPG